MRIQTQRPHVGEIRVGEGIEFRSGPKSSVAADGHALGGAFLEFGEIRLPPVARVFRACGNGQQDRDGQQAHQSSFAASSTRSSFWGGGSLHRNRQHALARNHLMHFHRPFSRRGLPQQPGIPRILTLVENVDGRKRHVGHFLVFDEHGRRGLKQSGVEAVVVALAVGQLDQLFEAGKLSLRGSRQRLHVAIQKVGAADDELQEFRAWFAPESSREFPE